MLHSAEQLPVFQFLPEISDILKQHGGVLISAAPGAGKTMLVPKLFSDIAGSGQVLLIEPRRIAARSAAMGIAAIHDLVPGKDCGYAVRGESLGNENSRIMAVTPGVMLQKLQNDPELNGVSAVIFDEFHERSLEMDLALALVLDVRDSLRENLLLGVMSASMDGDKLQKFLQLPLLELPGKTFPVEISYRDISSDLRDLSHDIVRVVLETLPSSEGDVLVFLPGADEIGKCFDLLSNVLPEEVVLCRLHGSLPFEEQKKALQTDREKRRKIILSTNVAESSLTVEGVRCVIDSGWEKRSCFDLDSRMNFLDSRRITLASAIQRSGRAGRLAPGKAVRCWNKVVENSFEKNIVPEILTAELSGMMMTLAQWGAKIEQLRFPDTPPESSCNQALSVLKGLKLLDENGKITACGREAARLPLQIRTAAMLCRCDEAERLSAMKIAAILEEKDDFRFYGSADLRMRLAEWDSDKRRFGIQKQIFNKIRNFFPECRRGDGDGAEAVALAFPEWVAKNRSKNSTEFQFAGARAGSLAENDPLRSAEYLAVARVDSRPGKSAAIRLALPLSAASVEKIFAGEITEKTEIFFDSANDRFYAKKVRRLHALIIRETPCPVPETGLVEALIDEAFRRGIELPGTEDKAGAAFLQRCRFAYQHGMDKMAVFAPENFQDALREISGTFLHDILSLNALKKVQWLPVLKALANYTSLMELEELFPEFFTTPAGVKCRIDYSGVQPTLSVPLQQMYGVKVHPVVGKEKLPLRIELLNPARRPVQISCDLPGFWQGNWHLVQKELRSSYPKHEWPDDPLNTLPGKSSVKRKN